MSPEEAGHSCLFPGHFYIYLVLVGELGLPVPPHEGPRAQWSPHCSIPGPTPHLPALRVGGTGKVRLGVAMPDMCTSVFHQQEIGEGEMFLSLLRGWAMAWPALGHLAGAGNHPGLKEGAVCGTLSSAHRESNLAVSKGVSLLSFSG